MLLERVILTDIFKWIPREEAVILTGPRQSGKTSLLRLIEKKLREQEKSVFFFNLEDEEILEYLNRSPSNLLKLVNVQGDQKVHVILDEIQYLKKPTNFLKLLYDDHRDRIKLIVSGSSAFYIDRRFRDSLAGRKKIFYILPLSFADFLIFKGVKSLPASAGEIVDLGAAESAPLNILEQREMDRLVEEYMLYGGYPKVVLENDISIKAELLQEIINSYIKKDVIEADIQSPQKFFALFKILASQVGSLVNENELANTIGVSTTAVRHYLYVMQKSFHVCFIKPFFNNVRKEITKMPKVFLLDTGLRNKLLNNFEPLDMRFDKGDIFENVIFKMLTDFYGFDSLKFWRSQSKNEVDFILDSKKKAIEVKYNLSLFKFKKYAFFLSRYPDYSFHVLYHKGEDKAEPLEKSVFTRKV